MDKKQTDKKNDNASTEQPIDDNISQSIVDKQQDLLNDIYMDLAVEIGRTKMKISELLNLSSGSIVQLDQPADEPLCIYANNKLIAKGHIVSSNGRYGIRII